MKIKTSELTGDALDWAVGHAKLGKSHAFSESDIVVWACYNKPSSQQFGDLIIEQECISVGYERYSSPDGKLWDAVLQLSPTKTYLEYGPTPLIAAMRCYVASKLGDEVEIPNKLMRNL